MGNQIYGLKNDFLRVLNLDTNTFNNRDLTVDDLLDGIAYGNNWGATWKDKNGNYYAINNRSGGVYKITDVENPSSTIFKKILIGSLTTSNDGFGCEIGSDPLDWDDDGIINAIDEDDDNDGILDVNESGGTGLDPEGDHDTDAIFNFRDPDIEGYIDTNGDTINDNFDVDLDGVPDAYDIDSDNDGCFDATEGAGAFTIVDLTSSNNLADADEGTVNLANGIPTNSGSPQAGTSFVINAGVLGVITAQPASSSICLGADAVYSVTTTGSDLTYQWQEKQELIRIPIFQMQEFIVVLIQTS
jgi:hypothetical protein